MVYYKMRRQKSQTIERKSLRRLFDSPILQWLPPRIRLELPCIGGIYTFLRISPFDHISVFCNSILECTWAIMWAIGALIGIQFETILNDDSLIHTRIFRHLSVIRMTSMECTFRNSFQMDFQKNRHFIICVNLACAFQMGIGPIKLTSKLVKSTACYVGQITSIFLLQQKRNHQTGWWINWFG